MFKNKLVYSFFNRLLITIIITLCILITCKKSTSFKSNFYNKVYEINFNFASINDLYKKYFGSFIPFSDMISDNIKPVFNEEFNYDSTPYMDGVSINVGSNYLVSTLESGLVIFTGNKDDYGNTVIIQTATGVDIWYANMNNVNVNLYEYVAKGKIIGEVNDNLYLVFKKDGKIIDYKEYLH